MAPEGAIGLHVVMVPVVVPVMVMMMPVGERWRRNSQRDNRRQRK